MKKGNSLVVLNFINLYDLSVIRFIRYYQFIYFESSGDNNFFQFISFNFYAKISNDIELKN